MKFGKLKYFLILMAILASIALSIWLIKKNKTSSMPATSANEILLKAVTHGNLKDLERALANGADVNTVNGNQPTALHLATYRCDEAMVRLLISKGANVNAVDENGITPLAWAAGCDDEAIVKLLLDNGADVNVHSSSNAFGRTPLHESIYRGKDKIVKLLLDHGADVNAQITGSLDKGQTALHLAVAYPYEKIVKLLLEHGADTTIKDAKGKIPHISHVLEILESQGETVNRPIHH